VSNYLTRLQIEKALPGALKHAATDELTTMINTLVQDPREAEMIRENFISYAHTLRDGKYRTTDYVHAVAYVSYKMMGLSNQDAYMKTFPQRYARMLADGLQPKEIASFVAAYNKNQLVNKILEQTLVPVWVLNQDLFQKALRTQADLMQNSNSDMVRTTAANSILTHLSKPKETVQNKLTLNVNENSGMQELKNLLTDLANKQIAHIRDGGSAKEIAAQRIVDVEPEDNDAG
jgi:hypothetical protein